MILWARYNSIMGWIWPAGLEFETYVLAASSRKKCHNAAIGLTFLHVLGSTSCFCQELQ